MIAAEKVREIVLKKMKIDFDSFQIDVEKRVGMEARKGLYCCYIELPRSAWGKRKIHSEYHDYMEKLKMAGFEAYFLDGYFQVKWD